MKRRSVSFPDNGDRISFFPRHRHHKCLSSHKDLITTLIAENGLTKAEIARQFHVSYSSFHSLIARARRKLLKRSKRLFVCYDPVSRKYNVCIRTKLGIGKLHQMGSSFLAVKFKNKTSESVKLSLKFIPVETLENSQNDLRYQAALKQNALAKTGAVKKLSLLRGSNENS
jgi:hypothetical protein